MRAPRAGFTLIELLVVISIIGMLASVIFAPLSSALVKARDAARRADMVEIQNALELYASDHNGTYPSSGGPSTWRSQCTEWGAFAPGDVIPGLVPEYLSSFPSDPEMNSSTDQDCFLYASNGQDYKLLDYAQTPDVNTGGSPKLVDPQRNAGRSWQVPNAPTGPCNNNGDIHATWALWSSPSAQCW